LPVRFCCLKLHFSLFSYYHRNLNPPKLVDIGFAPLPRGMTVSRLIAQQAVPAEPKIPGFREMTEKDIPEAGELLRKYLDRFDVAQQFSTDDDVRHWFLSGMGKAPKNGTVAIPGQPREGQVTWAYVVEVSTPASPIQC
jgi:glycylpeptide N-tetradecanoyltransferase